MLDDSTRDNHSKSLQIPKVVLGLNELHESPADLIAAFVIVVNESGQGIDASARELHDRFVVGRQPRDAVPNKQEEDIARERRDHQYGRTEKRAQKVEERNAQFRKCFEPMDVYWGNRSGDRSHQLEQIRIIVV